MGRLGKFGYIRAYKGICGYIWLYMGILGIFGYIRVYKDIFGYIWA